jgi:predicted  nucleic acid-binding Zn-ribbon protein
MSTDSLSGRIANIERELGAVKRKISGNRKRFKDAAASWSDIDTEKFKERVRKGREKSASDKVEL